MCGRYTLFSEQANPEILDIFREIKHKRADWQFKLGDIYPTNAAPILISDSSGIGAELSVWGFPKYKGSGVIINARAETAAEKTTFRDSLISRRCAVPSTGFYEWDKDKVKHLFRLPENETLYMAGIFKEYEKTLRFVILTTAANSSMKDIHSRMPVILPRDKIQMWTRDTDAAMLYLRTEMPNLIDKTG